MSLRNSIGILTTIALLAVAPKMYAQVAHTADSLFQATQGQGKDHRKEKGVIRQWLDDQRRITKERKDNERRVSAMKKKQGDPDHSLSNEQAHTLGIPNTSPTPAGTPTTPPHGTSTPEGIPNPNPTGEQILQMRGETVKSHYENHIRQGGEVIDMTVYPPNHPNYRPPQITEDGPEDSDE